MDGVFYTLGAIFFGLEIFRHILTLTASYFMARHDSCEDCIEQEMIEEIKRRERHDL